MRLHSLLFGSLFFMMIGIDADAYQLSIHQIAGYSKPLVLIMPDGVPAESIRKVHLHFHGWTQDPVSGAPYRKNFDFEWKDPQGIPTDQQLRTFIENYGIQKTVENSIDRAVLIPIARGRCDQYPELPGAMDDVSQKLFEESGIDPKQAVFDSASAHSGGGEVLSKILNSTSLMKTVRQVVIVDAIYHDSTRDRLVDWLRNATGSNPRTLELNVISGMRPQTYAKTILKGFKGDETRSDFQWKGSVFSATDKKIQNGNSILLIEEKKPFQLDHWTIVKVAFDWLSDPEVRRKPSSKKHSR